MEETIASCEAEVEELCRPFADEIALLDTAPGMSNPTAQDLIAETGVDMAHFPSARHLYSWDKLSSGNHESAGKRKSGRTGHGNKWLRATVVECAYAARHTKQTYLDGKFCRFASRKGTKRAAVMVAHRLLEATSFILRDKVPYQELGDQYFDERNKTQLLRHHLRRLESLGYQVELYPLPHPQCTMINENEGIFRGIIR